MITDAPRPRHVSGRLDGPVFLGLALTGMFVMPVRFLRVLTVTAVCAAFALLSGCGAGPSDVFSPTVNTNDNLHDPSRDEEDPPPPPDINDNEDLRDPEENVNEPPFANAGTDRYVYEGESVSLDGTRSFDPEGEPLSYLWTCDFPDLLDHVDAPTGIFHAPGVDQDTEFVVTLTVSDGLDEDQDTVSVIVLNAADSQSARLVADAGPDQTVTSGDLVVLDASASRGDQFGTLGFSWVQREGPSVVLADSSRVSTHFEAPDVDIATDLIFRVTVTQYGRSATDETRVTVLPAGGGGSSGGAGGGSGGGGAGGGSGGSGKANHPPTVSDQNAATEQNTSITLTLRGKDADNDDLTFEIVAPPSFGALGPINNSKRSSATVQYTPNSGFSGVDTFSFRCTDGVDTSNTAIFTISVAGGPIVSDQDAYTLQEQSIVLTLEGSDPEGDDLTFVITRQPTRGSLGPLDNSPSASASVTYTPNAGFSGSDTLRFYATDGVDSSVEAVVRITVYPTVVFDVAPLSGQRPLNVTCTATTVNGAPLPEGTYVWAFDGVEDSGTMNTHKQRSRTFSSAGPHTIRLSLILTGLAAPVSCHDARTNQDTAYATVHPVVRGYVLTSSGNPVSGVTVSASNGGSTGITDSSGQYLVHVPYDWSGSVKPERNNTTFDPTQRSHARVTADLRDQNFTAFFENEPPRANAGPDQTVVDADGNGSEAVTLDGRGSTDSDGTIVSYEWTQNDQRIATGSRPTVTLARGTHTIVLTVTDNGGATGNDTVIINVVEAGAGQRYYVAGNDPNASDSNPGTEARPFKTIQKACDIVNPGDTVYIKAATYPRPSGRSRVIELQRGGASGAPITFTAFGDGPVILDNQGGGDWVAYVNARYRPVDHIVLKGLTFTGGVSGGLYVRNSSYTVVDRCKAVNNRGIGIYIGLGGSDQVVQYCEVAYNVIGLKAGSNTAPPHPTRVTLQYNYCHHNDDPSYSGNSDGLQVGGPGNDYAIVRGNVIHDNGDDGIDVGNAAQFALIERNVVYNHRDDDGDGSGIKLGTHEVGIAPDGGHLVRYNIVFNNKLRNLDMAGNYRDSERGLRPPPIVAHNNTLFNCNNDVVYCEDMDVILRNNIAYAPGNAPFWSCRLRGDNIEPPNADSDYNLWGDRWIKDWDGSLRQDLDAHSVTGNPLFMDPNNPGVNTDLNSPNFGDVPGLRLSNGSPAVDKAVEIRAELQRMLDIARQQNRTKWIAALEFALSQTPQPQSYQGAGPDMGAYP